MADAKLDLNKRVGPGSFKLALWQWGVVAVVAFLVIRRYFGASTTAAPATGATAGGRKARGRGARGPRGPRGPKGAKGAKGAGGGGGGGGGGKGKGKAAAADPLALVEDTAPIVPVPEQIPSGTIGTSSATAPPTLPQGVAWHPQRQRPLKAKARAGSIDAVSDPATATPELAAPGELGGV